MPRASGGSCGDALTRRADRELRLRLRDVVRRRPGGDRARHPPVERRVSRRRRLRAPLDGLPRHRPRCLPEPSGVLRHPRARRVGGIVVTGSHNDASWNALKFFGPDGALLNAAKNEELLDVYHGAAFDLATWDRLIPVDTAPDVEERYLEYLASALDVDLIRERRFKVAVDFTNGACGAIASRFLESLGCTCSP